MKEMKNIVSCIFIVCLLTINANEIENFHNSRGWRPISNMEALSRFGINIPNSNILQKSTPSWNPTEDFDEYNVNVFKNNVLRIVKPQQVYGDFKIKRHGHFLPMEEKTDPPIDYKRKHKDDSNCNELKTEETKSQHILVIPKTDKNVRKSKKMTLENNINDINKHSDQTKEVFMNFKQESTNKKTVEVNDSYEVTENPETIDISKAEPSQNHHGYIYKPPKQDSNVTKSNPTETLSKILSKYNLNSKDELQNYAISRVSSAQNTLKSNLPDVPFKVSSFNYLPVNPLLAVLLSNYGYYLPGAFGIRNNYRNLYGYLASNNIHNNKPFGSYKIYSDTDSYNK